MSAIAGLSDIQADGDSPPYAKVRSVVLIRPTGLQRAIVRRLHTHRCELAADLMRDYTVTLVDPFDGSGNGPTNPDFYREKFPIVNIIQGLLTRDNFFRGHDAVISTSVVEHIDPEYHNKTVAGLHESLVVGGYSIHAIDVTRRSVNGFLEKTIEICESWIKPMKSMVGE